MKQLLVALFLFFHLLFGLKGQDVLSVTIDWTNPFIGAEVSMKPIKPLIVNNLQKHNSLNLKILKSKNIYKRNLGIKESADYRLKIKLQNGDSVESIIFLSPEPTYISLKRTNGVEKFYTIQNRGYEQSAAFLEKLVIPENLLSLKRIRDSLRMILDTINKDIIMRLSDSLNIGMRMHNMLIAKQYIEKNTNSLINTKLIYLHILNRLPKAAVKELFYLLPKALRRNFYGSQIKMNINAADVGDYFPLLILKNVNQQPQKITTTSNGYTLIEFWASWCIPCRAKKDSMFYLYKECASKKLNIISISIDTDKVQWLSAIQQDKKNWLNIIVTNELKDISKVLNIATIPTTYLLDSQGIIIYKNPNFSTIIDCLKQTL
ncbi:MAG: hypothetical protein RL115_2116 [Bacteroidota bacterium]|jgi:thiol-disulfide isomerase/thioredoxin